MGKFLALDYGTRRIGVASGEAGIAFPREVFKNRGLKANVLKIKELVDELSVTTVVIGLPLNMELDMPENYHMSDVKVLADAVKIALKGVDVVLFDERLTSFEAERIMADVKDCGAGDDLGKDAFEAQVILQRFFDKSDS